MKTTLAEYLSQVPVFVRNFEGVILHWTGGAEELYGFSAEEAIGRVSHHLLQTEFPVDSSALTGGRLTQLPLLCRPNYKNRASIDHLPSTNKVPSM